MLCIFRCVDVCNSVDQNQANFAFNERCELVTSHIAKARYEYFGQLFFPLNNHFVLK